MGVAHKAEILSIKVLNDEEPISQGSFDALVNGLNFAINQGADVINMSIIFNNVLSVPSNNVLRKVLQKAFDLDIMVIASSGDSNQNVANFIPASYPEVFTVGGVDWNNKAGKNNFGKN